VGGVRVDRSAPRGERELHMGEAYAATAQAIPPGPQYVAMGHIHAPQTVPGAPVPAEYAGSLLSLDFGEAGEDKRVVIVDAEPGRLAVARTVLLEGGRRLVRVTGTWDQIEARAPELAERYCDLTVTTSGTDATLAERAREAFPFLVKVRAHRPGTAAAERLVKGARTWDQLYGDYYRREHDEDAPPELLALFREILEEADASA
jgi:DNA repair protein SbcD/Mre11